MFLFLYFFGCLFYLWMDKKREKNEMLLLFRYRFFCEKWKMESDRAVMRGTSRAFLALDMRHAATILIITIYTYMSAMLKLSKNVSLALNRTAEWPFKRWKSQCWARQRTCTYRIIIIIVRAEKIKSYQSIFIHADSINLCRARAKWLWIANSLKTLYRCFFCYFFFFHGCSRAISSAYSRFEKTFFKYAYTYIQ